MANCELATYVAAINAVFAHLWASLTAAVKKSKQILTFIGYTARRSNFLKLLNELEGESKSQMDEVARIYGEVVQLESLILSSSDGNAELRMREAASKTAIAKSEMELEIGRAKSEEDYLEAMRESELEQLRFV
eukprot:scaffold249348_cov72-Cyclotella_meneghiniana.AAC.7